MEETKDTPNSMRSVDTIMHEYVSRDENRQTTIERLEYKGIPHDQIVQYINEWNKLSSDQYGFEDCKTV